MKRQFILLITTLLLAFLVFARDEQARREDKEPVLNPTLAPEGQQQEVLDVDVPPEIGPDGECLMEWL